MDKQIVVYLYNEILLSSKQECIINPHNNMEKGLFYTHSRERGWGRERNINVREKYQSVASHIHNQLRTKPTI